MIFQFGCINYYYSDDVQFLSRSTLQLSPVDSAWMIPCTGTTLQVERLLLTVSRVPLISRRMEMLQISTQYFAAAQDTRLKIEKVKAAVIQVGTVTTVPCTWLGWHPENYSTEQQPSFIFNVLSSVVQNF